MAVYATDHPFRGIRDVKYQQMHSERLEELRAMTRQEVQDYVDECAHYYQRRVGELVAPCMVKCGATPEVMERDPILYYDNLDRANKMAMDVAYAEFLEL